MARIAGRGVVLGQPLRTLSVTNPVPHALSWMVESAVSGGIRLLERMGDGVGSAARLALVTGRHAVETGGVKFKSGGGHGDLG